MTAAMEEEQKKKKKKKKWRRGRRGKPKEEKKGNGGSRKNSDTAQEVVCEPNKGEHLRIYGLPEGDVKLVYKILHRLIEACDLGSIVKNVRVSVLRKIGQERFFKVTGSGIIDAKLVTPLSLLGNQMGFKVRVMFQNPRRPKGKKFQFDRRLVYGFATHNVGTAKKKKIEILNYMNEVDVNVLALQETKRTFRDGTWKVPDCVVFEY